MSPPLNFSSAHSCAEKGEVGEILKGVLRAGSQELEALPQNPKVCLS